MKYINKNNFFSLMCSLFISLYLTGIINEGTLTTTLQRVFVYVYLIAIITISVHYINKKITNKSLLGLKWLVLIVAIIIATITSDKLLPKKYSDIYVNIVLLEEKNAESKGREAWITDVLLDGKRVENINLADSGWSQQGSSIYANKDEGDAVMSVYLPKKKELTLEFGRHEWSGMVAVCYEGEKEIYDLYFKGNNTIQLKFPSPSADYNDIVKTIMWIGLCIIYYELGKVCVAMIGKNRNN